MDPRTAKTRARVCPVCGAALREDESLRAVMAGIDANGREEIRIRGCPHCLSLNQPEK